MAKVSLRTYNREIESLIEQGQLDEAIAHCRHILNIYPKHLETYRLLGKAYLEAKRYPEAIDIFQRLLNAVPDDFVAHVGMSIICDEQNKLDDAIWHMERAYEVQPSNSAIQAELQRLYGRRDGVEPPKIRLTRGALAHMYMHGELYTQAISEIKKVLEEDPNRQDMLTLLARAYFQAGQKTEAAETCNQLLRRYAYNLDANRVLVELLPAAERGESTQVYRQRVNEMEPYAAFVRDSIFRFDSVPDAAVSIERLDWNGQTVEQGPAWEKALGTGLESPPSSGDQPDWLRAGLTEEPVSASFPDEGPATPPQGTPPSGSASDIPDFLREAGWSESSGAFQETPSIAETEATPPLAAADLPDWIKAMAPAEAQSSPPGESIELPEEELPDWLREVSPGESTPQAQPLEQTDLRSWLPPEQTEEDSTTAASAAMASETSAGLPEESPPPSGGDTSVPTPPAASMEIDNLGTSPGEQDDALAWLESLAAKHGAKPEELLTKPEERLENEPEWVQQAKSLSVETGPIAETPAPPEETPPDDLPDFLKEAMRAQAKIPPVEAPPPPTSAASEAGDLGTSPGEQDDALAWLEGLAAKHGAKPEELLTKPEERRETEPDWVLRARERGESRPTAETPAAPTDETGMWLRDLEASAQEAPTQPEPSAEQPPEGLPDWLTGIESTPTAAESAAPGGEAGWQPEESTLPPEEEEHPPEWLRALETATPAQAVEEKPVTDLPDWLTGLDEEKSPEAVASSETLPDWLREGDEGMPPAPQPVSPAEWTPVEAPPPQPPADETPPTPPVEKPTPPPYREPVTRSRSGMTGMLSMTSDPTLSKAQAELSRGNIPAAIELYSKLIKKGRLLDEIIFDLREALYRYPIEVIIWQALGDAYLRANRLQDSLDAYTKAEELLR
ncbi:MAG: hypothetical protein Fur0043_06740 [Anaerolineales bacterium]